MTASESKPPVSTPAQAPFNGRAARMRDTILKAAFELFAARGFDAAMEELAAAADVSKQTIYNHFGSKEGLLSAMVAARVAELTEPLIASEHDQSPHDVLEAFSRTYLATALSARHIAFMKAMTAAPYSLANFAAQFYTLGPARTLAALADWMAMETRRRRLAVFDARLAAEQFLGAIIGHGQIRQMLGSGVAPTEEECAARAAMAVRAFMRAYGV